MGKINLILIFTVKKNMVQRFYCITLNSVTKKNTKKTQNLKPVESYLFVKNTAKKNFEA